MQFIRIVLNLNLQIIVSSVTLPLIIEFVVNKNVKIIQPCKVCMQLSSSFFNCTNLKTQYRKLFYLILGLYRKIQILIEIYIFLPVRRGELG